MERISKDKWGKLGPALRNWFAHNSWLKLLALVAAVGVWFLASRWVYIRTSMVVPVSLKLAPGMVVRSITPASATVTLDYPREIGGVSKDDESRIRVVHDLTEAIEPGKIVFTLTASEVEAPFRTRIIAITPSRINAEIDRLVEKVLPVKVTYWGKPRPGYRISGETVLPPEVLVPGPESLLASMKAIETEPIRVMGRSNPFETPVKLKPVIPFSETKLEPVNVFVVIAEELARRQISEVPVTILKEPTQTGEISLEPAKVTLYLRGQEKALEVLTPEDTKAYVDIIGLKTGSYELPLKTGLPQGINLERADPAVIKVILGRGPVDLLKPGI